MNEPRNLDAQLQTINRKFTSEFKDFYNAGTNFKLIKHLIKIHVLRLLLRLSEIFYENEINILQEEFLRILDLPELYHTTMQDLLTALKSLMVTSGNTSKLDRQTKSKIDAITIPTELSTFSVYTPIRELSKNLSFFCIIIYDDKIPPYLI